MIWVIFMANENAFCETDVLKSYHWLDHKEHGFTELLALHPAYKPGKENIEYNTSNDTFPKIWYSKSDFLPKTSSLI